MVLEWHAAEALQIRIGDSNLQTMWRRSATARLKSLWRQFPAVLIVGARQVGKTTLARQAFPRLPYCDIEEPRTRQLFTADPTFQIESRTERGLILDEAQCVPEIFASLRSLIDQRCKQHRPCLILGSARPSLLLPGSTDLSELNCIDQAPLVGERGKAEIGISIHRVSSELGSFRASPAHRVLVPRRTARVYKPANGRDTVEN